MVNHQTHGRSQGRKIIAVAVLSLLVLRGLSFLGIAGAFADSSNVTKPIVSALYVDEHCDRAQDKSDRGRPIHDCSHYCALCASAARDLIVPDVPNFTGTDALYARVNISPLTFYPDELGSARPPGLIANWSATSPPRIS